MKSKFVKSLLVVIGALALGLIPMTAQQETVATELTWNTFNPAEPLGISMTEWMAATGTGTYSVENWIGEGDMATVNLSFSSLVPNGVYSLWCQQVTVSPEFEVVSRPCGLPNGSENVFEADAEGQGAIRLTFPALPDATETSMPVLAIMWHRDGQTHGSDPGLFGINTFTQLHVPVVTVAE